MSFNINEIVIATLNSGKLREIGELLRDSPIRILSLADHSDIVEVEETGATFAENAALKASEYARLTGLFTLADDSGLEIDALSGRPGVLSARYGGEDTGFDEKMRLVLGEIEKTDGLGRGAQFVCSMAVAAPNGDIVYTAEGLCRGSIADSPRGTGGFGYDPIFIPVGHEMTFGELSSAVKHEISHRARALAEIIPFLRDNSVV